MRPPAARYLATVPGPRGRSAGMSRRRMPSSTRSAAARGSSVAASHSCGFPNGVERPTSGSTFPRDRDLKASSAKFARTVSGKSKKSEPPSLRNSAPVGQVAASAGSNGAASRGSRTRPPCEGDLPPAAVEAVRGSAGASAMSQTT
eukprot:4039368-Lingulodinium_polyedra.AAC.1